MKFLKTALVVCLILILAVFSLQNSDIVLEAVRSQVKGVEELDKLPKAISEALVSDDTYMRNQLVDLSGLYYRLTARRSMNDIVKLNNGMLTDEHIDVEDMTPYSAAAGKLSDWLAEQDIPFLFVQFPYKLDIEKKLLPMGYTNGSSDNAMAILKQMQELGVNTLDLYTAMGTTAQQIEDAFYDTDHHWRPSAAFKAFQATAEKLQEMFPDQPILGQIMLDEEQWTKHSIPGQFLGSRGKRVGTLYAGVDDLEWLTPNFETEMSTYVPKHADYRAGSFNDAMIVQRYIDDPASLHRLNHYCVYIGGDYPLVHHRNAKAPVDMKVMIIKDSFALPYQAFMATLFTEVDVLDPRHYDLNTLPEYIQMSQPDLVMMPVNPSVINRDSYFFYDYPTTDPEPVETVVDTDIQMRPMENNYRYRVIAKELQPDTVYRLRVGDLQVTDGEFTGVNVMLYDFDKRVRYDSTCFDLTYGPGEYGYEWTFRVPEGDRDLQLLIYAGVSGSTSMNGLKCADVVLEMLE